MSLSGKLTFGPTNVGMTSHLPMMHAGLFPVHVFPHMPQFFGSLCVSTHCPPHAVCPIGQHMPPVHCETIAVHAMPHMPQLSLFVWRSTHFPEQTVIVQTPESAPVSWVLESFVDESFAVESGFDP